MHEDAGLKELEDNEETQAHLQLLDNYMGLSFLGLYFVMHMLYYCLIRKRTSREFRKLSMNGQQLEEMFGIDDKKPWIRVEPRYHTQYWSQYKWTDSYTTSSNALFVSPDAEHLPRMNSWMTPRGTQRKYFTSHDFEVPR